MALDQNYFSAGRNLSDGVRAGEQATLSELLNQVGFGTESGRALHVVVNPEPSILTADGSRGRPYGPSQIQDAVDKAGQEMSSSRFDPVTIYFGAGVHDMGDDELVVKYDGIQLVGVSQNITTIKSNGVALTVTNATLESLSTWRTSGDYTDLEYDPTINSGHGPQFFVAQGIAFDSGDGDHVVDLIGVQGDDTASTTSFGWDNDNFVGGLILYGVFASGNLSPIIYGRNCGIVDCYHMQLGLGQEYVNCYYVAHSYCHMGAGVDMTYDAVDPGGAPELGHYAHEFYQCQMHDVTLSGSAVANVRMSECDDIFLSGTSVLTLYECTQGYDSGTDVVDIDDTAELATFGGTMTGDFDIEGGGKVTSVNTLFSRDFVLASGAGAITLRGGRFITAPSGAGTGRITHTQGDIGT